MDRPGRADQPGQFLLLSRASPALLRQAGESLLGRVETTKVTPLDIAEVAAGAPWQSARADRLWLRGGFPRSWLAESDSDGFAWRRQAVASHVEFDLPQIGIGIAAPAMLRFWRMLAHSHGQIWSAADLARSLGVSEPTVRRHLDTLTQTLMVRQIQPWHANLAKRQVKAPRSTCATAACCTRCWTSPRCSSCSCTPAAARAGRVLRSNRCCGSPAPSRRTSGPRTKAPNSIC